MGVWIETSHRIYTEKVLTVTPYVGVWIETPPMKAPTSLMLSLLMWECGLKHIKKLPFVIFDTSLLMWECGLKLHGRNRRGRDKRSLLMWECGLKPKD